MTAPNRFYSQLPHEIFSIYCPGNLHCGSYFTAANFTNFISGDKIMCTLPFDQNICTWSSFIYSFFSAPPLDQKLGFSLIYFLYLLTAIRPNYVILFHLFFLQCTTIRPKLRFLVDFSFLQCTTIRPKVKVVIDLFLSFTHNHLAKIYDRLSFIFPLS